MNFRPVTDSEQSMQLAPMIDIIFLLLVFFVATYAMTQMERELSVTLPRAQATDDSVARVNEIVVNVLIDGTIRINNQDMDIEQLYQRLEALKRFGIAPGVIIRADGECAHKYIVAVMGACRRADIPHIYIGAIPGERLDDENL